MESAYDRKFEEMKKYIPFLESMIKRLESTSSAAANPRQAQLDKIKSLRDLLQDKKKRMKMENLLKCEQVLVNLYAKVEQRDSLPEKPKQKEDKDLESVRNKLKSVSTNLVDNKDTLPEIARASEIEEVCTPGSKEPALFQRRPNLKSISPARNAPKSPNKPPPQSSAKRSYTRVLVSPEPRPPRWESPDSNSDKPLFSRRSPRRSPKGVSPAYHKKERKKSKQGSSKKAKDLNITLNVPEESLDSLNTKDILTRIMKCNDNDVDIETLREAKRQILSELNQTGAKCDDISDLLLKSYKDSKKNKPVNKETEVEEGELSDSESEAIESIYGDVLRDNKYKQSSSSKSQNSDEKEQPRKIQICLVINSDKEGKSTEISKTDELTKNLNNADASEFQMYDHTDDKSSDLKTKLSEEHPSQDVSDSKIDKSDSKAKVAEKDLHEVPEPKENVIKPANFYKPLDHESNEKNDSLKSDSKNHEVTEPTKKATPSQKSENTPSNEASNSLVPGDSNEAKSAETVKIPLLNEPTPFTDERKVKETKGNIVSEIDILQALKNEILSESLSIPGSETVTPALHQPKLTKVASAQEIAPKKRISFEKYKEKAVPTAKATTPLFIKDSSQSTKEDQSKKQSLKLTMKECERFNFPTKLALEEDGVSDDEEADKNPLDNIYDNIAPKSPDQIDSSEVGNTLPVIIPVDSIKTPTIASTGDVDMRTLIPPVLKSVGPNALPFSSPIANTSQRQSKNRQKNKINIPSDPRLRKDLNQPEGAPLLPLMGINLDNPFPQLTNPEKPPLLPLPPTIYFPNMTPNSAPNMTPAMNPSMTPSMTPVMTPNARSFEMSSIQPFDPDDNSGQKHVYAPMFTPFDREKESSVARETIPNYKPEVEDRQNRWKTKKDSNPTRNWDERDSRSSMQRDGPDHQKSRCSDPYNNYNKFHKNTIYNVDRRGEPSSRTECPLTPVHSFGRSDCPSTPTHSFGRHEAPMTPLPSFGRAECPPTPSYPFGRSEGPQTPSHPFGRSDSQTPNYPFGGTECPTTPSHPFGRSDCPTTPSHPFGRIECPSTPSHPFGRVDMPVTPSHPFGRSDNTTRDPRLNRNSDVDNYKRQERDRNSGYYKDRNSMNYNPHNEKNYGGSDSFKPYKEQNTGRNDRFNKYSSHGPDSRQYNREQRGPGREPSIGRSMSRDHGEERFYSRDRGYRHKGNEHHSGSDNSNSDFGVRKGFYRERSIGRSEPDERQHRDFRATSVGRIYGKTEEKRMSVKPDTGRSFTIDTSVTTTFQDFLDTGRKIQVFDYSFDSRKKRASSVGRSLCRESSVGRTLPQKPRQTNEPFENVRRNDFRRAASVGRDLSSPKAEKSFRDIKAEFQLFKSKCDARQSKVVETTSYVKKDHSRPDMSSNRPSRKDFYENKSKNIPETNTKKPYSPRKNYRDPRMRKDFNASKNRDSKFDERNRRNAGIVYSNDNITKGTILGSGYGVKNYKIPKIKRPVEEQEEKKPDKDETTKKPEKSETAKKPDKADFQKKAVQGKTETNKKGVVSKPNTSDSVSDSKTQKKELQRKTSVEKAVTDKNKTVKADDDKSVKIKKVNEDRLDKQNIEHKTEISEIPDSNSDTIDTVEKRVTRSSRKSTSSPQSVTTKSRSKKAVIYDTDSDEEQLQEKKQKSVTSPNKIKVNAAAKNNEKCKPVSSLDDNSNTGDLDSSFGIDDLEIFPDGIVSDPVIDNINALIEDLDNDLASTKVVTPTDFSSDLTLETMLASITNQEKEETKSLNEEESLNMISEVIKNDLDQSNKNKKPLKTNEDAKSTEKITSDVDVTKDVEKSIQQVNVKIDQTSELKIKTVDNLKCDQTVSPSNVKSVSVNRDDNTVTTSDNDNGQQLDQVDKSEEHMDVDGCSTPDSTINTELTENTQSQQEIIPDSTNEIQNEPNSIVSSTHDNAEPVSLNKDTTTAIDSIGNILSLLQNKSKIKELLSMLGEQSSDNDKIKKKLEKLSEIVSDEEEESRDGNVDITETSQTDDANVKESSAPLVEKDVIPLKDDNSSSKLKYDQIDDLKDDDNLKGNIKDVQKTCENDDGITNLSITSVTTLQNEKQKSKSPKKITKKKLKFLADTKKTNEIINQEEVKNDADNNAVLESEEKVSDKVSTAKKAPVKKTKRKGGKFKNVAIKAKRVTRSSLQAGSSKRGRKNELLKLQEDLKEMFMRDEVLNATGIRMCRLAKLVDDNKEEGRESTLNEPTPVVVVEKVKHIDLREETLSAKTKIKQKHKESPSLVEIEKKTNKVKPSKYKPGPKSKTKLLQKQDDEDDDPYAFESDSVSDMVNDEASTKSNDGKDVSTSESEDESLASSKSVASSEVLNELKKKPKRKRSSWQTGVIKPRSKKKKSDAKQADTKQSDISLNDDTLITKKPVRTGPVTIPDLNCFTDKLYCFRKDVTEYPCRLCKYVGPDIVHHYKQQHPHSEIPLSRMNPETARDAIEQCEEINFQAVSKIPTDKYVCRFCFKEFGKKKSGGILESFFWHVVSMHTGEYKKLCSECINITRCPFNLDIPPPPKDAKGQLIGYICEKCNFTQISLENLKTHVIVRHNDEQTEVYTINLAVMSKKMINTLLKRYNASATLESEQRVLRSSRSNQSMEASDDRSDVTDSDHTNEPIANRIKRTKKLPSVSSVTDEPPAKSKYHSKITFENNDDNSDNASNGGDSVSTIKVEREELEDEFLNPENTQNLPEKPAETYAPDAPADDTPHNNSSDDIFAYPHFKISYTDAGLKEYVCCINGVENHYKTTLLISMKKHVQTKHSELWDGYCFVCKVIVTPQGQHEFKECLQHYLDMHMDNFPVLEKPVQVAEPEAPPEVITPPKPKIHVRPLSELICTDSDSVETAEELPTLPKIESIVSLSAQPEEVAEPEEPRYEPPKIPFKYEEVQAEVMSKKQQVVLATMMTKEKLMNVYKCAGRFCSFTTDFIEDALQHASTHQRIGGENSMTCAYCNFDYTVEIANAIDLVMHVFKSHGSCPYVCGHCFYRAAASQLVTAHITRAHRGSKMVVLRSTVVPPPAPKDTSMLTREQAVQYYVCGHAPCKFRTYTAKKFFEHLLQTHPSELKRPCFLCSETPASPSELVQHMKAHELNVYQCTWCVHGADNEAALLAHTAAEHPAKQPQAYLRVITKKDGSEEYRVLPLASFNKSKVTVEEVPPSGSKDNPVREAERSIELEKLIGHTNQMIESMATMTPVEPSAPQPAPVETPNTQAVITKITAPVPETPPIEVPPRQLTPTPTTLEEERSKMKTPILKTEPEETVTPSKDLSGDVIYCLDSDDDEDNSSTQNVIDLSEEETTPSAEPAPTPKPVEEMPKKKSHFVKIQPSELFKCPNCFATFKNTAGFKRHTNICFVKYEGPMVCAHCSKEVTDREELILHYTSDHDPTAGNSTYICGICSEKFTLMFLAKRHMKVIHKIYKMIISSNKQDDDSFVYTVKPNTVADKAAPKRKLSSSNPVEPPAKKRYGPQDVDQLPINPILDELVYCSECEFNTKVRLNLVRHLQLHAQQQPAPNTAPVNPVPHLETNEMHFDKMVNLASSSIVTRAPDKTNTPNTTVTSQISAEEASRYPKLIAERQRYACGAKDCSYISLDEAMFNRHWNALHSSLNHFRCVHCTRNLFDTRPLTCERVMEHLKMHDSTLYGCSTCLFCHFKKDQVEKHLATVHKTAKLVVVREEVEAQTRAEPQAASRMDLKLWQCGLCPFRSLLRPAIIEHCGKIHQSKMQYKCGHCPFRASSLENVCKHQSNSHPGKGEDIFYYFYQDGTVPEESDGVPKWQKQRQKVGVTEPDAEVKTEVADSTVTPVASQQTPITPVASGSAPSLDLNIVKQELTDTFPDDDESLEVLCQKYGQFCEPNGLSYKCPLCAVVEDTLESMQSHLFEELKYRRYACTLCPYRAFHGAGFAAHVASEHRGRRLPPRALPRDLSVEKWVAALLQHQGTAIATNKENLAKQKILTERPAKPTKPDVAPSAEEPKPKPTMTELEKAFGPFGQPSNMMYCCPKCPFKVKEEAAMRDHLEGELTKIRWHCSHCTVTFQTYHEAQFHCKSVHFRQAARPREAARDPALRSAWLAAALQVQKLSMKSLPLTHLPEPDPLAPEPEPAPDNSLLVVRYEEDVTVAEEPPRNPPAAVTPASRKRPAPSTDSDDERLVIDEPSPPAGPSGLGVAKKRTGAPGGKCPYCDMQTKYTHTLRDHICNTHYGVKPYQCTVCNYHDFRNKVRAHVVASHPHCEPNSVIVPTPLPARPPPPAAPAPTEAVHVAAPASDVCLTCQAVLSKSATEAHLREKGDHVIVAKGDVIVKCCLCLTLFKDVVSHRDHHRLAHGDASMQYAHFRILDDSRDIRVCGYCGKRSVNASEMAAHHAFAHADLPVKYKDEPQLTFVSSSSQDENAGFNRTNDKANPPPRKVARKSTSKLPAQTVAKKSTTKLPFYAAETPLEYSYYGTKPTPIEKYENVTTLMSFFNTMVPFNMKKLSEIIKISPKVIVKDVGNKHPSGK